MARRVRATQAAWQSALDHIKLALNGIHPAIVGDGMVDSIDRVIMVGIAVSGIPTIMQLVLTFMEDNNRDYPPTPNGLTRRLSDMVPALKMLTEHTRYSVEQKVVVIRCSVDGYFMHFNITMHNLQQHNAVVNAAQEWMRRASHKMREEIHCRMTGEALTTDRRRLRVIHHRRFNFLHVDPSDPAAVAAAAAVAAQHYDAVFVVGTDGVTEYTADQPPAPMAGDPMEVFATALGTASSSEPVATPAAPPPFVPFGGQGHKLIELYNESEDPILKELLIDCELYEQVEYDAIQAALKEHTSSESEGDDDDEEPQSANFFDWDALDVAMAARAP